MDPPFTHWYNYHVLIFDVLNKFYILVVNHCSSDMSTLNQMLLLATVSIMYHADFLGVGGGWGVGVGWGVAAFVPGACCKSFCAPSPCISA